MIVMYQCCFQLHPFNPDEIERMRVEMDEKFCRDLLGNDKTNKFGGSSEIGGAKVAADLEIQKAHENSFSKLKHTKPINYIDMSSVVFYISSSIKIMNYTDNILYHSILIVSTIRSCESKQTLLVSFKIFHIEESWPLQRALASLHGLIPRPQHY